MSSTYQNTVERMEHDIGFIDASAGWASIAISLKRIADVLQRWDERMAAQEGTNCHEFGGNLE